MHAVMGFLVNCCGNPSWDVICVVLSPFSLALLSVVVLPFSLAFLSAVVFFVPRKGRARQDTVILFFEGIHSPSSPRRPWYIVVRRPPN